jgi:L,D-peptidoglycan transpeptidase YkuD (ErfK/YbiS/YcfS/YnhG family)
MRAVYCGLLAFVIAGCGPAPPLNTNPPQPPQGPMPPKSLNADQAIVVWSSGQSGFDAKLTAWQRGSNGWNWVLGPIPAVIGPNGFAPSGEKREGDGRTPSGTFRIGTAFGHDAALETKLRYRQATADDFWVDDPQSPQYNRWLTGKPDAKSFEKLRQPAYKYAAVIEYNTDPVVPGKGSAIFLHVWGGPDKPTAGCVAVSEDQLVELLRWLDKRQKPVIVLNSQ